MSKNDVRLALTEMVTGDGVFVATHVGMYRATQKLTAEDLGLDELPKEAISLGTLKLLPDSICPELEAMRKIENKVNHLVRSNTFRFEGMGNYAKTEKAVQLAKDLHDLKVQYNKAFISFLENYEQRQEDSIDYWLVKAPALNIEEEAMRNLVTASFIPRTSLRVKFRFSIVFIKMPKPATVVWENAKEELAAMTDTFVESTVKQLRSEALTAISSMGDALQDGKWNQKTLDKATNMLERIKDMQLVEDTELVSCIEDFTRKHLTRKAPEIKENHNAFAALSSGIAETVNNLRTIASEDSKEMVMRAFNLKARKINK